jgi:nucleotide-binding universal stress UspA family protein
MVYLVEVNGSHPSQLAMRYAAERCRERAEATVAPRVRPPSGDDRATVACQSSRSASPLYLLHVSPSARAAEIESGRRLLEECRDRCRFVASGIDVQTCLEVGDRVERLAQTAERVAADCVVVGSHDATEFPRLASVGEMARAAVERMPRPVIVVGLDGARCYDRAEQEATHAADE